ncbi:MAG: efflux RND transporter periplasmic adaptor subunit [Bacteroidales bacterium]|nr:efflux RND transporter periplasmic adaptor subunit [Bacteroidales bacterium]
MEKSKLLTSFASIAFVALSLTMGSCSKDAKISLVTVHPERGEMSQTVTATGTVESKTQVDVGTQVTGIISELYVDFNSPVTKGQLIAEIEKTLLESELKSADANMESARLTYEYNKTNYERDKKLHEQQLISDYEFDTSKKEYEVSKTSYEKSQADRVKAAKNLNYAEIYSPIDGIVISREVEVGQTVVSSMNVANLYVIADLQNMEVVGNVDEADIGQVKVGQEVTFTVDAYPDDVFTGTVSQVRINPTTESNVVTYEVIVDTPNKDMKLIPGLTANLTIYVMHEKDVLMLPVKTLRFTPHDYPEARNLPQANTEGLAPLPDDGDQRRVWVERGDKLEPVTITVGANNGVNVAVLSGLTTDDKVAEEYSTTVVAEEDASSSADQSPFAPKRPGQDKEKNKK